LLFETMSLKLLEIIFLVTGQYKASKYTLFLNQ
jgi:hypothetical protein